MSSSTSKREGRIICGFAGIGKSKATEKWLKVVDLESTPFMKNWCIYIRVAKHMANNGYTVLLSCHKELREKMLLEGVDFTTVLPENNPLNKKRYLERYADRGNNKLFIEMMDKNWSQFNETLTGEKIYILAPNKYLSDVLPEII